MERFIDNLEADAFWRKLSEKNFYKNLYVSLSYLHSVLDGRAEYGTLGWNIYSGFDASDFEIS